jgi:CyaY protein
MSSLTELEYHNLIDAAFIAIEEKIDAFEEPDIEAESADGIITLVFENGTKIVLNKQEPWIDERGAGEFWAFLDDAISKQAGVPVTLGIAND